MPKNGGRLVSLSFRTQMVQKSKVIVQREHKHTFFSTGLWRAA